MDKEVKKAILSLSGGLDSTALLLHLIDRGYDSIHTISYNYGQKNWIELDGLANILHYLELQGHKIPNKRIDLLIESFNILQKPLLIIGDGPERKKLQLIAKSNIKFLGKIPNEKVEEYMSRCRAFVYAGLEDFGIAPVEAIASGAPVIAYGKGGILDTVNCLINGDENQVYTGILFKEQTSADIVDTIKWFEDTKSWKEFNPQSLNNYAQKFCPDNFKQKFDFFINKSWDNFSNKKQL